MKHRTSTNYLSLEELSRLCNEALDQYRHTSASDTDSDSCAEIVRRAAHAEKEALRYLLKLSDPLIRNLVQYKWPESLRQAHSVDDVVQEVSLRLVRKFYNRASPFQASTFPEYRNFLTLTVRSVALNIITREAEVDSLEALQESSEVEDHRPPIISEMEAQELVQHCLSMLPDPMERAVIYHRLILNDDVDHIREMLALIEPDITKNKIYRLVEKGIRHLRTRPELRALFGKD